MPNTLTVANNVGQGRVDASDAGTTTSGHLNGSTEPTWMGYANGAAPASVTPTTFSDDSTYKIRTHVDFTFLVDSSGSVLTGSPSVTAVERTGTTHFAPFEINLIKCISQDYGITPPNLSYNETDANSYTGDATPVNVVATGLAPGKAYLPHVFPQKVDSSGQRVATKVISGGTIGYRPLIGQTAVDNGVAAWAAAVTAAYQAGKLPAAVADAAGTTYSNFFDNHPANSNASLFGEAPPIWQNVSIQMCANWTVTSTALAPDSGQGNRLSLVTQSHMPNLYLYTDDSPVDDLGASLSSPTAVQQGNFALFSSDPVSHPSDTGPFNACDMANRGHAGNPWEIGIDPAFSSYQPDFRPTSVHYCGAPTQPYGDAGSDG